MKGHLAMALLFCLFLAGCDHKEEDGVIIHREFYQTIWERFDFVSEKIEIKEPTTFDLDLRICFTDDYPAETFSMVFAVLNDDGTPYRSKGYKFTVKDNKGNWKSDAVEGVYTFELPINKALQITEPGSYRFKIEQTMPKTPLVGVKELTLYNKLMNNNQ